MKYIIYWKIVIAFTSFNDKPIDIWGHRINQNRRVEKMDEHHSIIFDIRQSADSFYKITTKQSDVNNVRLDSIYTSNK